MLRLHGRSVRFLVDSLGLRVSGLQRELEVNIYGYC